MFTQLCVSCVPSFCSFMKQWLILFWKPLSLESLLIHSDVLHQGKEKNNCYLSFICVVQKKASKKVVATGAFAEKLVVTATPDNGRKKVEDKGSSKKEKERQKKEEKERQKREESQERLRRKEEKQRRKEDDSRAKKKKGFFSKLKHKLKQPGHHDDKPRGDGAADVSGREGDGEFVFVRTDVKEEDGATGGASVTALDVAGMAFYAEGCLIIL